jgi:FKBP-type peptidyl-prolyl cis-trans isomerase FkpA
LTWLTPRYPDPGYSLSRRQGAVNDKPQDTAMAIHHLRRYTLLLALGASLGLAACGGGGSDGSSTPVDTDPGWASVTDPKIVSEVVGTGNVANFAMTPGKLVTVIYSAWLYDKNLSNNKGTKVFDNVNLTYTLARGGVFGGVEYGTAGMKEGGKRTVLSPAGWSFGKTGNAANGIPPNAALVIDIQLIKVE